MIASDVNGVRELISDGESGYLVEPRAEEIAARLRELAARPRRCAPASALPRARVGAALPLGGADGARGTTELFGDALAAG